MLCGSLHGRVCVYVFFCKCVCVCVCDYPCCYQRQAAIHSGWNERFSSVTKQFLCFHGAMILSKSQRKQRGEKKKNQCPPSPTASLSLAGCRHASTHTNTCIHRQWETQKQMKSCLCDVNCKYLIFFFSPKEVDSSISWIFLIIAVWKGNDPEQL